MIIFKLFHIFIHILWGLTQAILIFPLITRPAQLRRIERWSRKLLKIFNLNVLVQGETAALESYIAQRGAIIQKSNPKPGKFYISNHISWIDVFVLNSVNPMTFLAKSDIRQWPLFGALCHYTGTLFIDRTKRQAIRSALHAIRDRLATGENVCFFPEGTTSDGKTILPFLSNIFEAPVGKDILIQPILLFYHHKNSHEQSFATAYIDDMDILTSIKNILRAKETTATIVCGQAFSAKPYHRRQLSAECYQWMNQELLKIQSIATQNIQTPLDEPIQEDAPFFNAK